eukprot:COSAG01_NODE_13558_length_1567_cov_34.875341_1_plen_74_part_00
MGDDLLWAMSTLGFENYMEPLKTYLFRYREMTIKPGDADADAPPPQLWCSGNWCGRDDNASIDSSWAVSRDRD